MKKEYSQKEIRDILKNDVQIPDKVEAGMQAAYDRIGMRDQVTMRYTKKHRWMVGFAAAAVLVMGTSLGVVAANKLLTANMEEKGDEIGYHFQVDRSKEAHEIEVTPEYMPEGLVYQKDGPFGGKWRNNETGEGISIITYNASELDEMEQLENRVWLQFKKSSMVKDTMIDDRKLNMFTTENIYADSEDKMISMFLLDEENGCLIQIFSEGTLSEEELTKVAEGLKITVTDKVVPYKTEEELAELKLKEKGSDESEKDLEAYYDKGVAADAVKAVGEEIENPYFKARGEAAGDADIRFTVESAEVRDSLPEAEFPKANFRNYEAELAPWLNADGTLKEHERYRFHYGEGGRWTDREGKDTETASSKFVVVKMKAEYYTDGDTEKDQDVSIAPDLMTLVKKEDGNYSFTQEYFVPANKGYELQWEMGNGASAPVYYDDPYYTEGVERERDFLFRTMQPGEEREYTLVYVVDEDQLGQMYLNCYPGAQTVEDVVNQYVNISK